LASDQASQELAALARELLFARPEPALDPFRAVWPPGPQPGGNSTAPRQSAAPPPSSAVPRIPATTPPLPVLAWLPDIAAERHEFAGTLIAALCRTATSLLWRQTYSLEEIGAEFLRNYGYTEIMGPNAPRAYRQLSCGFLLLGPQTTYPRHHHEAEEIYVTLTGAAEWLQGDAVWRRHPAGTLIHHASREAHAMRTADRPLLALYLWRGADLNQKARLDSDEASSHGEIT